MIISVLFVDYKENLLSLSSYVKMGVSCVCWLAKKQLDKCLSLDYIRSVIDSGVDS